MKIVTKAVTPRRLRQRDVVTVANVNVHVTLAAAANIGKIEYEND